MSHNETEYLTLRALAKQIQQHAPKALATLAEWEEEAERLRASADFNALAGERGLEALAFDLRRRWLSVADGLAAEYLKSPPLGQSIHVPSGAEVDYQYERINQVDYLEKKLSDYRPQVPQWTVEHILFSSCLASITTFLQTIINMYDGEQLRLAAFGKYFETHSLFDLFKSSSFRWQRCRRQAELNTVLSDLENSPDILALEPVVYDRDMDVFELDSFIKAWQQCVTKLPRVIIVDTTLVGATFPIQRLLEGMENGDNPPIVAHVASGIKYDQAGLELGNVGMLSLYTHISLEGLLDASAIAAMLRDGRAMLGTSVPINTLFALDLPWVFDLHQLTSFTQAVFENNALLARSVDKLGGNIFAKVIHPVLGPQASLPWAQAPFVTFHLYEEGLVNYLFLCEVMADEAQRQGLCFNFGTSFGFRGHRYEFLVAAEPIMFKIAMGARCGPSRDKIIALICQLSQYSDLASLRDYYPDASICADHKAQQIYNHRAGD